MGSTSLVSRTKLGWANVSTVYMLEWASVRTVANKDLQARKLPVTRIVGTERQIKS
uniref:AlNc14C357G10960 protein n=1 Tax=Albugo laibachii Nc14 TaxID=890382 RepID=F0WXK9_9STRA|nr:AlNc14C357G10960 [Albugo laibachii Nc14]|eukprot:CCA26203.1 AlNc14C357G10960 [Albugo laibachii Nc14]